MAGWMATEERLAARLTNCALQELIAAAVAEFGEELVVAQVVSFSEADPKPAGVIVTAWIQGRHDRIPCAPRDWAGGKARENGQW